MAHKSTTDRLGRIWYVGDRVVIKPEFTCRPEQAYQIVGVYETPGIVQLLRIGVLDDDGEIYSDDEPIEYLDDFDIEDWVEVPEAEWPSSDPTGTGDPKLLIESCLHLKLLP